MKKVLLLMACAALLSACGDMSESDPKSDEATDEIAQSDDLSPDLPQEPKTRDQASFDDYAWQLFVAMNWPASNSERGVPDKSKKIGDPGTVVWQSLRTSESVFLPNGADPGPWNSGYPMEITLSNIAKASPEVVEHLTSIQQAVGGPLIDQDGNYTYYEKYMNETEYDFVTTNQYYDKSILDQQTVDLSLPTESMEIKSAWKIMTSNDKQDEFFTAEATINQLDGTTMDATVGLVGLHIIVKTKGSPQWVWATFEQKNNVPGDPGVTATHFSYNNPDCDTCRANKATKWPTPTQVTRYTPIEDAAVAANSKWQKLLEGTVWENYVLITTQWPSNPGDPGDPQGTPMPTLSANTTMETYIQPTSSCMACHSSARTPNNRIKTDYSFLFLEASSPE